MVRECAECGNLRKRLIRLHINGRCNCEAPHEDGICGDVWLCRYCFHTIEPLDV